MSLKCPKCKIELVPTKKLICYETLGEHVVDPNGTRPLRHGLTCPNKCYPRRIFWGEDGSVYKPNDWLVNLSFKIGMFHTFNKLGIRLKDVKVEDAIGNIYEDKEK